MRVLNTKKYVQYFLKRELWRILPPGVEAFARDLFDRIRLCNRLQSLDLMHFQRCACEEVAPRRWPLH